MVLSFCFTLHYYVFVAETLNEKFITLPNKVEKQMTVTNK